MTSLAFIFTVLSVAALEIISCVDCCTRSLYVVWGVVNVRCRAVNIVVDVQAVTGVTKYLVLVLVCGLAVDVVAQVISFTPPGHSSFGFITTISASVITDIV